MKRLIAALIAACLIIVALPAFAQTPEQYPLHFAVIADQANVYGDAMYIAGSIYANSEIKLGNGSGNRVDGILVAPVITHVNDDGTTEGINEYSVNVETNGQIFDTNTLFNYSVGTFTIPEVNNVIAQDTMSVYYNDVWGWSAERGSYSEPGPDAPKTIIEDTHFQTLTMNGTENNWRNLDAAMVIDTSKSDVTVVIDELNAVNPSIKIVGSHTANIYLRASELANARIFGGSANLYFTGDELTIRHSDIEAQNIFCNAASVTIEGSSRVVCSELRSSASQVTITGGNTEFYGIVYVPQANSYVINSGTLYGQIYTDTLTINGAGRIIYEIDTQYSAIEEESVILPSGKPIDLRGIRYAYIFGYEPEIYVEDGQYVARVQMAPDDAVTREQIAAMLSRLIDQKFGTVNEQYDVTAELSDYADTWFIRGVNYLFQKGAFDQAVTGAVTRGEVAKLVSFGLNLSNREETSFIDIANNPYKPYIEIMATNGFMRGVSATEFEPDRIMTRAEFCALINNIIGRDEMTLETQEGGVISPETYYIVDLDNHWAQDAMLKATSVYDNEGHVVIADRYSNIRNILDNFNSQTMF